MRFLLDEPMPVQLLEVLRLNAPHEFEHIDEVKWKGKLDEFLIHDAAAQGFDAIVTLDVDQLSDPELCRALARSGLHHVSLRQGRRAVGKTGVARVIASIIAAMPYVVDDLEAADGQRVVEIALLSAGARHESLDPKRERQRLPYWP
jgi:predicted nuclease of predicted toxin-antitoxin system